MQDFQRPVALLPTSCLHLGCSPGWLAKLLLLGGSYVVAVQLAIRLAVAFRVQYMSPVLLGSYHALATEPLHQHRAGYLGRYLVGSSSMVMRVAPQGTACFSPLPHIEL